MVNVGQEHTTFVKKSYFVLTPGLLDSMFIPGGTGGGGIGGVPGPLCEP